MSSTGTLTRPFSHQATLSHARFAARIGLSEKMLLLPHAFRLSQLASHLVGGLATPLKNMNVNWDDDIPNIWENKKCSKPPTRHVYPQIYPMISHIP